MRSVWAGLMKPGRDRGRESTTRPTQLWVAGITYIPTWDGFLYLAAVPDVWGRKIVG
jgi:putative transposase